MGSIKVQKISTDPIRTAGDESVGTMGKFEQTEGTLLDCTGSGNAEEGNFKRQDPSAMKRMLAGMLIADAN